MCSCENDAEAPGEVMDLAGSLFSLDAAAARTSRGYSVVGLRQEAPDFLGDLLARVKRSTLGSLLG